MGTSKALFIPKRPQRTDTLRCLILRTLALRTNLLSILPLATRTTITRTLTSILLHTRALRFTILHSLLIAIFKQISNRRRQTALTKPRRNTTTTSRQAIRTHNPQRRRQRKAPRLTIITKRRKLYRGQTSIPLNTLQNPQRILTNPAQIRTFSAIPTTIPKQIRQIPLPTTTFRGAPTFPFTSLTIINLILAPLTLHLTTLAFSILKYQPLSTLTQRENKAWILTTFAKSNSIIKRISAFCTRSVIYTFCAFFMTIVAGKIFIYAIKYRVIWVFTDAYEYFSVLVGYLVFV